MFTALVNSKMLLQQSPRGRRFGDRSFLPSLPTQIATPQRHTPQEGSRGNFLSATVRLFLIHYLFSEGNKPAAPDFLGEFPASREAKTQSLKLTIFISSSHPWCLVSGVCPLLQLVPSLEEGTSCVCEVVSRGYLGPF